MCSCYFVGTLNSSSGVWFKTESKRQNSSHQNRNKSWPSQNGVEFLAEIKEDCQRLPCKRNLMISQSSLSAKSSLQSLKMLSLHSTYLPKSLGKVSSTVASACDSAFLDFNAEFILPPWGQDRKEWDEQPHDLCSYEAEQSCNDRKVQFLP